MLFKDNVPMSDNAFLGSSEEAKKMLKMLDVKYISYHACPYNCIIYRGKYGYKEI